MMAQDKRTKKGIKVVREEPIDDEVFDVDTAPRTGMGGQNKIVIAIGAIALIALVSYIIAPLAAVSNDDFTRNVANVLTLIDEGDDAVREEVAGQISSVENRTNEAIDGLDFSKYDEQISEIKNNIDSRLAEATGKVDQKLAGIDSRFNGYVTQETFNQLNLTDGIDQRFEDLKMELEVTIDSGIDDLRNSVDANEIDRLKEDIRAAEDDIIDLQRDVRNLDSNSSSSGSSSSTPDGSNIYAEIVDLDDSGWLWLKANAPKGHVLLIEFFSADNSFPAVGDFDVTIQDEYQITTKFGSASLIRVFIEPVWAPDDWRDVEVRLGYSHSEAVDYINAVFVAINRDRNW